MWNPAPPARKAILGWSLLLLAIAWFVVPLVRTKYAILIQTPYHPEYYRGQPFPFPGYIYPVLLIALLALALSPSLIPAQRLAPAAQQEICRMSLFAVCLLGILALCYAVWVVVTPIF